MFSTALRTGIVPSHMAHYLAAALEVGNALLSAVMETTAWQLRDETRAQVLAREKAYAVSFRPHLRAETARIRPEPVFVAALLGVARLRHVPLTDQVWCVSDDERDSLVKRTICDHYRSQDGWVPAFGAILSYTLVTLPGYQVDFGFPFDLNGDRVGPMRPVQRLGEAVLGTKRNDVRLTGLLKDVPITTIRVDRHQ